MANFSTYYPEEQINRQYRLADALRQQPQGSGNSWAGILGNGIRAVGGNVIQGDANNALQGNQNLRTQSIQNVSNANDAPSLSKALLGSPVPEIQDLGLKTHIQQVTDDPNKDYRVRAAQAVQNGLKPGTAEFRSFVLAGQLPAPKDPLDQEYKRAQIDALRLKGDGEIKEVNGKLVRITPNGTATEIYSAGPAPKDPLDQEYKRAQIDALRNKTNDVSTPAGRAASAQQFGLDPNSDAGRAYILTGKLPREDQQALTATDKKAILEADDMVSTNKAVIQALDEAISFNPKANQGWFAGTRAALGNNLPDMMVPDFISSPESSAATANLDNAVVGQALAQLKAVFGGNPTEGERKILLDLQGSSSQPANVRAEIFARARRAATSRLQINEQRANALRGGTFYKPGAGSQAVVDVPSPSGQQGQSETKTINGKTYQKIDGQWFEQ